MGSEGLGLRVGLEGNLLTSSANLVEGLEFVVGKLREALLSGLDIWVYVYGSRSRHCKTSTLAKLLFGEIDLGVIGLDRVKVACTFSKLSKLVIMGVEFEGVEPSAKAVVTGLAT